MSFIGLDRIFETSADFDSATNTPARNAPIATDNPTIFANNAYPKHTPKTLSNKISRFSALATLSINFGTVRIPIVKVPTIKIVATTTTATAPSIETVPANAIDSNDAIKITAITSSTINIPKTKIEDSFLIFPVSSKTFTIIAVLLIDNAADMNNESMNPSPSSVDA